jgi:cephalosporin hydroxylase
MRVLEKERIDGLLASAQLRRLTGNAMPKSDTSMSQRSFDSAVGHDLLDALQGGMFTQKYKGRKIILNPFDMANLLQLVQEVRPGTVFEIGTAAGGRALWLSDTLPALGCESQVVAVDIVAPVPFDNPRIRFLHGDVAKLGSFLTEEMLQLFPRPWVVIEDAAHFGDLTEAIVSFFDPLLRTGDWLLIEYGILNQITGSEASAISVFIDQFLQNRGDAYAIATEYCDRFGYNVTNNPNGWLRHK